MSDLINRDVLNEAIDNTDLYSGEYKLHLGAKDEESAYYRAQDIRDAINSAPTIEAESVRHGYWIENKGGTGISCSECGKRRRYRDFDDCYCPRCGAKMDEVTSE